MINHFSSLIVEPFIGLCRESQVLADYFLIKVLTNAREGITVVHIIWVT